ncbi:hypothetical protein BS614_04305 [Paenibacillus xylanexedens]|uniref:hypothetical protein n=1 Tax=Paenibacillus xylanexedens TaxID=528191 RepID=UPI000938431B|nr:hypothetical protein [Paenibacillus xylanexedens]APO43353.1 hypothetical protein BS614_04305 [Paenibacillus xylanexedens]
MAATFKRLGAGNVSAANSTLTAYTVPVSYKAIIKSFIISNGSAGNVNLIVRMGSVEILFNYIMKPYDTIVVPVMDQLLIAGNTITFYASAGNSISYYISGIEALTTDPEYIDVTRFGLGLVPSDLGNIVTSSAKDRLVKGIILCNTNSADTRVYMNVSTRNILQGFMIKAYETILVPTTDLLIPATEVIAASGYGINYYITGKELG